MRVARRTGRSASRGAPRATLTLLLIMMVCVVAYEQIVPNVRTRIKALTSTVTSTMLTLAGADDDKYDGMYDDAGKDNDNKNSDNSNEDKKKSRQ